ncbi:MAG TPA: hypothetical protein VFG63_15480 [Nocardioidaceae bacterium]|nr:hypothetical protein [Nocardioidaceae bacterium]
MIGLSRWRSWAAAVLIVLVASGCTTATPAPDAYRARTKLAVTDAISHVATAQKVLEATRKNKILGPYALVTVRASDETLGTVVGAYLELYPPQQLDPRFTKASTLLGDASDLVTQTRIALYRDDRADFPGLIKDLDSLSTKLERFEKELS